MIRTITDYLTELSSKDALDAGLARGLLHRWEAEGDLLDASYEYAADVLSCAHRMVKTGPRPELSDDMRAASSRKDAERQIDAIALNALRLVSKIWASYLVHPDCALTVSSISAPLAEEEILPAVRGYVRTLFVRRVALLRLNLCSDLLIGAITRVVNADREQVQGIMERIPLESPVNKKTLSKAATEYVDGMLQSSL